MKFFSKKNISQTLLPFFVINLSFNVNANGAVDGLLGEISSGEVDVTLVLGNSVSISGVDDVDFSEWNGLGPLLNIDDVCIYSNTTRYQITASGTTMSNDPSKFAVTSQTISGIYYIPFLVMWNDVNIFDGSLSMLPNQTLTNQSGASNADLNCNGQSNALVAISFAEDDLVKAISGDYSGVLTLSISPE